MKLSVQNSVCKMEVICTANVAMISLLLAVVVPVFTSAGTVFQIPSASRSNQSPPCKQFNSTMLDCSARNFSAVPTDLLPTATGVDLSMNKISDLNGYHFYNLALLRSLNLSLNALQTIGNNTFRNLVSLQTLDLSKNSIQYLDEDAFSGLVELVQLDLSKNSIISVPPAAFRDLGNLQELLLFFNDISEIPSDAMVHLRKVHTLDLSFNSYPLWELGFQLGEGFKSMKSLKRLLLSGMNIQYLPDNTFSALRSLPVTFLDLSWNGLLVIGNDTFNSLENLRQLSLRNTNYDALYRLPSGLLELDLAGVLPYIVPNGRLTVHVVRRLSRYLPNITSISFAKTKMKNIQDSALVYMNTLQRLDLSQNSLGIQALYLTNKTFEGLNNLQELHLSANSLPAVPTDALSAFNHTRSLRLLNLADNKLFHLNAGAFASVPFLTSLNLEGNGLFSLGNSLEVLQNLECLYLANNKFYQLPPFDWKTILPGLQVLDISHNEGGEYLTDTLSHFAPNLKELYVNNIEVNFELAVLFNCTSLVTLDVSQNGISDYSFYDSSKYGWAALTLPHLENLNLGANLITSLSAVVFDGNPNLRRINVSQNALKTVDERTFANLTKLEILDLSFNALSNISALNPQLPSLRSVTLSRNKVSFIDVKLLAASRQPALRVLDLSHNAYACTCEIQDFQNWLLEDTRLFLQSPSDYRCNSPEDLQGDLVVKIVLDYCVSYLALYLGVGLASGFILILLVVGLCVRYHWHLRYKVFLMFRRGLVRRQVEDDGDAADDGQENNNMPKFDAFVSYNDHDRNWVLQQLIPNLEDHQDDDVRFRLCVSDRDLPAGDSKVDVIVEAIQCSRRTILVLSDHFLESEWCYYEMQMAHLRLFNEGRDVLVLILLGEISDHKMTMLLRQTLCRKNYLKWPRDGLGQQLFWERLREELKISPAVNRRLDA